MGPGRRSPDRPERARGVIVWARARTPRARADDRLLVQTDRISAISVGKVPLPGPISSKKSVCCTGPSGSMHIRKRLPEEEAAGAEAAEPSRGGKPARDESSFRAARSKMRNGGEMPQMVYAKKVAETELQYDKKLEEAEAEAQRWFKEKKAAEITTLKAGVTIMQAFFEHRKRKFLQQLAEDRATWPSCESDNAKHAENERLRVEMAERGIAAAEAQMVETTEVSTKKGLLGIACHAVSVQVFNMFFFNVLQRVAELEAAQAKELKDLDALQRETEERAFRAERAVKLGDAEISRLQDVEKSLRFEIEDLRVRLQESERAEELHRAKEKAEFLEEELRKTRERMRTQRHLEAEELRRELMDYVKFIVKILPEEWQERLGPEIWRQVSKTELQVPMMIQAAEAMAEPPDTPAPPPPELEPATPASGHETDASEGSGET
ncbi:unnamed protein product [Durusdinium trenchii]|uniref:Uncharacterized protein n=1 Tax=Durusdinium trenchii TaxID=1381693 RepID=A0ABP0RCW4_9DINO